MWVEQIDSVQPLTFSQLQSSAVFWLPGFQLGFFCAYSKFIKLKNETKAQTVLQQ